MERRVPTLAHAALIALAAASAAAFATAYGAWPVLVLLLPMLTSGFRRLERLPLRAQAALRWAGWLLAGGVAALPLLVTFQSVYLAQVTRIAVPAGVGLCLLVTLFLYSAPAWTPAKTVLPVSLALLASAGLQRELSSVVVLYSIAGICVAIHVAAHRRLQTAPLVLFAAIAGLVATGISLLLPWAQPWVESKAADLVISSPTARAGLSLTSRLGEIEELALSPAIAMRVWSSEPQYLRARVYTRFNGHAWSAATANTRQPLVSAPALDSDLARWIEEVPGNTFAVPGAPDGPPQIRTRILQDHLIAGVLPAPGQTVLARLSGSPGWVDDAGVLTPAQTAPEMYALVNRRDRDVAQSVSAPSEDCLDVTAVSDPRLRELAARLGAGADQVEKVRRTAAHLESTCTYSLKVGAFHSADPVGEFVFDKRRGYCEYFASAAALLLRLQGVPARYVVGYSVRSSNLEGGHYVVRDADAHAWVEAYLPGRGWVEIDPTPAAQFESMRAPIRGGVGAGLWERLKSWGAELGALFRLGALVPALRRFVFPLLAIAVAAGLIFTARRRLRACFARGRNGTTAPDAGGVPAELVHLMRTLDGVWKRSGHPRPASRAPLEHLRGLPSPSRIGLELVEAFYRCRYGGSAPTQNEIAGLRRGLGDALLSRPAWRRSGVPGFPDADRPA
jgi:hypothetical protein